MNFAIDQLAWDKMNGLIPAIVQDNITHQTLMLGYMNAASLAQTIETKLVTFFSRSKNALWVKGDTSGNQLQLCEIFADCDQDALLITATPTGAICHQGTQSCFNTLENDGVIARLESTIVQRKQQPSNNSYVAKLFAQGLQRIAQKVGEEGVEVALAAMGTDPQALTEEAADLLFHLLVLLQAKDLCYADVLAVLQKRSKN
jgi:phosphoribosyl-ATP pyrophosphohydrolase/phosphoribosyl-AMP cyclohydrolase